MSTVSGDYGDPTLGGFTILDFNRLRRAGPEAAQVAPLLAASIFLDIFNVFLFFLQIFGGDES